MSSLIFPFCLFYSTIECKCVNASVTLVDDCVIFDVISQSEMQSWHLTRGEHGEHSMSKHCGSNVALCDLGFGQVAKAKGLRYDASPMNSRPPVCPSVCNTFFSELALRFFLIFHMKLGPEFSGKLSFVPNLGICAQTGPKIWFLDFCSKLIQRIWLETV